MVWFLDTYILEKIFGSSDGFMGPQQVLGQRELLSSVPIGKVWLFWNSQDTTFFSRCHTFRLRTVCGSLFRDSFDSKLRSSIGFNSYFLAQHTFLTGNVPSNFREKVLPTSVVPGSLGIVRRAIHGDVCEYYWDEAFISLHVSFCAYNNFFAGILFSR